MNSRLKTAVLALPWLFAQLGAQDQLPINTSISSEWVVINLHAPKAELRWHGESSTVTIPAAQSLDHVSVVDRTLLYFLGQTAAGQRIWVYDCEDLKHPVLVNQIETPRTLLAATGYRSSVMGFGIVGLAADGQTVLIKTGSTWDIPYRFDQPVNTVSHVRLSSKGAHSPLEQSRIRITRGVGLGLRPVGDLVLCNGKWSFAAYLRDKRWISVVRPITCNAGLVPVGSSEAGTIELRDDSGSLVASGPHPGGGAIVGLSTPTLHCNTQYTVTLKGTSRESVFRPYVRLSTARRRGGAFLTDLRCTTKSYTCGSPLAAINVKANYLSRPKSPDGTWLIGVAFTRANESPPMSAGSLDPTWVRSKPSRVAAQNATLGAFLPVLPKETGQRVWAQVCWSSGGDVAFSEIVGVDVADRGRRSYMSTSANAKRWSGTETGAALLTWRSLARTMK